MFPLAHIKYQVYVNYCWIALKIRYSFNIPVLIQQRKQTKNPVFSLPRHTNLLCLIFAFIWLLKLIYICTVKLNFNQGTKWTNIPHHFKPSYFPIIFFLCSWFCKLPQCETSEDFSGQSKDSMLEFLNKCIKMHFRD